MLLVFLLTSLLPSSLLGSDRWNWSIHEQGYLPGLNALASSGNMVVAVGDSGQILASADSISWTRCRTLTATKLSDIAWSGSAFVAVGEGGMILRSTDGMNWTRQTSGTSSNLSKIAWNGSRFFVSGGGGGISSDGIQWSFGVTSAPEMHDLTVDGSVFLGIRGLVAYFSADGVSWTNSTVKTNTSFDDVPSIVRSGGVYYASVEQSIYSSLDGNSWTEVNWLYENARLFSNGSALFALGQHVWFPGQDNVWRRGYQSFSDKFRDVLSFGAKYLAIDQGGRIAVSSDLQAWNFPVHNSLNASAFPVAKPLYFKSRIIAAGAVSPPNSIQGLYSSADGRFWNLQSGYSTDYYALAANENRVLATGRNKLVLESTDGSNWQQLPQGTAGSTYYSIAWNGEKFFGLTVGGGLYSSVSGSNWQMILPDELNCLFWTGTRYLAGGYGGIFASDNGLQWTRVAEAEQSITKITVGPGGFYAVDYENKIHRSIDGLVWNTVYSPNSTANLLDIVWTGSDLVAVGLGVVARSTDGINWTGGGVSSQLTSIAWTGSQLVAVGHNGAVMRSSNGAAWTDSTVAGSPALLDIVWAGSQLIAVAKLGKIFTSPDGQTWTERQSGIATDLKCVQMRGSLIVAAGDSGRVISSPDGITWTIQNSGLSRTCKDLLVKDGQVVGLFEGNILSSSLNGVQWNAGPVRGLGEATRLLWNGTSLIAIGENSYSSPDGQVWTAGGDGPSSYFLFNMVWNGTRFIAVRDSKIHSSPDGLQWTEAPIVVDKLTSIATSGPVTVIVSSDGDIYRSTDGLTWADVSPLADSSPVYFLGIVWDGSRFIASSPDLCVSSTDGLAWSAIGSGPLNDVASNGSEFVAVGADGRIRHSTDGTNWQSYNQNTFADLNAVSFANGAWFAAGNQGTLFRSQDGHSWMVANTGLGAVSAGKVSWNGSIYLAGAGRYTSTDGWTWTSRQTPDAMTWTIADGNIFRGEFSGTSIGYSLESRDGISWSRVSSRSKLTGAVYGGGLFVATGAGGELLTSTDGDAWRIVDSPTRAWLKSVTWTGSMFVAVGLSSTVMTSSDGITWQRVTTSGLPTSTSLNSVIWTGTRLVIVAASNRIFTSTNATSWSAATNPTSITMEKLAWSGSTLVAVGASGGIISSADGVTWTRRTSNTASSLWGITWTGSQFVAVGNSGVIVTSPDGTTWTLRSIGATTNLFAVAANGNKIVAAGSNLSVFVSENGINWTAVDTGVGTYDFALSNQGQLYLFGSSGLVIKSTDALTWKILRRGAIRTPLPPVNFGNQRWTADTFFTYSIERPDLLWKQSRASNFQILAHHWTGSRFVAVGSAGGVETSLNGLDWSESFIPTNDQIAAVASTSNRVVIVGNSGTLASAANPAASLSGMAAWIHSRSLARGEEPTATGAYGANELLEYGMGVPFAQNGVSLYDLEPRLLSGGRLGIEFAVPITDRPDLRYVVEQSTTMAPDSWLTIASKNPGETWKGSATITSKLFAEYWQMVEVQSTTQLPLSKCFHRLKIEHISH